MKANYCRISALFVAKVAPPVAKEASLVAKVPLFAAKVALYSGPRPWDNRPKT